MWGWEAPRVTEYRLDGSDVVWYDPRTWLRLRIVGVTTKEPEWNDDEYSLMSAFTAYEADLHTCGHPLAETTSILADPSNSNGEWVYKAQLPFRCHACDALELAKKPYSGTNFDPSRVWTVDKVPRV